MAGAAIGCSVYDASIVQGFGGADVGSGGSSSPPVGSSGSSATTGTGSASTSGAGGASGAGPLPDGSSASGTTTTAATGAGGGDGAGTGGAGVGTTGSEGAGSGAGGVTGAGTAGAGVGTGGTGGVTADGGRTDGGTGGGAGAGTVADAGDSGRTAPTTFQDLCSFTRAVVVTNNSATDTASSLQLLAEIQTACGTSIAIRQAPQNTAGLLAADGRPLWTASELGMLGGGPAVHNAASYLEKNLSPVYAQTTSSAYEWVDRVGRNVVISFPKASLSPTHDVAIIQVIREPMGGTFSLNVYGQGAQGTVAAAFFFKTQLAPGLKINSGIYNVVEWTDQDGDMEPSAGDLYQVRGYR